jgi:hypothetical protein
MRRTKMHDDLAHETQAHQLDTQGHEEHGQQQRRAVGYSLTLHPLNEKYQA